MSVATELAEARARIAALESANADKDAKLAAIEAAKAKAAKLSMKLSVPTGAGSLYGMGQFPVTMYREQWERLFSEGKAIVEAFLADPDIMACSASKTDTPETKAAKALRRKGMYDSGDTRFNLPKPKAA